MDRKNVFSVENLPFEKNFRNFFKQDNKIIGAMNRVIKENNNNQVGMNGVCYYNNFVGEDNCQVYSQDGLISFYSTYDEKYFSPYCCGSFSGAKSGTNVNFYLQAHDKNSFLAKYSITENLGDNKTQITRGLQVFDGEKTTTLENGVFQDDLGRTVYAYSTFVKRYGENVETEIISNEFEKGLQTLNTQKQSDLGKFRNDLLLCTPGTDQVHMVNDVFASSEQSSKMVDEVCSFIKDYVSLENLQESQEN